MGYRVELLDISDFLPVQYTNSNAILREMASLLIKHLAGCRLLQGPFALPPTVALATKVLSSWGARLTWTAQREHAA